MDEDIVTELSPDECWEMLRGEEFGRLAFRLVDEVHITPINYAVDGDTLLFRTAEGGKLLSGGDGGRRGLRDRPVRRGVGAQRRRPGAPRGCSPRTRPTAPRTCRCGPGSRA